MILPIHLFGSIRRQEVGVSPGHDTEAGVGLQLDAKVRQDPLKEGEVTSHPIDWPMHGCVPHSAHK